MTKALFIQTATSILLDATLTCADNPTPKSMSRVSLEIPQIVKTRRLKDSCGAQS